MSADTQAEGRRLPVDRRAQARVRRPGEPRALAYVYLAPALLVFALFMAWPLIRAVWLSFYEWDGLSTGTFVGLDNYRAVLTDPVLREPFVHALELLVFFSVLPILLGLTLAGLMSRTKVRASGFFRTVIFVPQVITMVVVAIAWRAIYAPGGPLDDAVSLVGLQPPEDGWLGSPSTALICVGLVGTWIGTGLCMVLFLAGLSKVPRELWEAATLDGAGPARQFLSVGLPALRGEIAVATTLTVVAALRTFDLVYVMTGGGPGTSTVVPSYEVWRWALGAGRVGYGVTIALVLMAIIMTITVVVNKVAESGDA